jgi:hypothetical protein
MRQLDCALPNFRVRLDPGAIRFLIGQTELTHARVLNS